MLSLSIFLLVLPLTLAQFTSLPENPEIGDSVILRCRLSAGEQQFTSTVPSLKVNESLYYFSFDDITIKLKDSRYHGLHLPDLNNRRNLRGDISIFYVREEDFAITFTCSGQLENDTFIEHTLKLNTTQPDTPIFECTPTNTMSNSTLITDPTISPTHTHSQEECTLWKVLFGAVTPITVTLVIIILFFIIILVYIVARYLQKISKQKSVSRAQVTSKEGPIADQPVATDPSTVGQEEDPNHEDVNHS